jgi:general secretion pathway protein G
VIARRISNLRSQISNSEIPGFGPDTGLHASESARAAVGEKVLRARLNAPGFTLLELMVVLTILLILATMSMPIFQLAIVHAREAVLKEDLYTLRKLIDEYTLDKQKPPTSLDDLVEAGYLRGGLPVDPFTGSSETWQTDTEEVPTSPSEAASGIVNVHSGSSDTALDGTAYSSW